MTVAIRRLVVTPARTVVAPLQRRPAPAPFLGNGGFFSEPAVVWVELQASRGCGLTIVDATVEIEKDVVSLGEVPAGPSTLSRTIPDGLPLPPTKLALRAAGKRCPIWLPVAPPRSVLREILTSVSDRLPGFPAPALGAATMADPCQRAFSFEIDFPARGTAPPAPLDPTSPIYSWWWRFVSPLAAPQQPEAESPLPRTPPRLIVTLRDRRCASRWSAPTIITPPGLAQGARAYYSDPHDDAFADLGELSVASRDAAAVGSTIRALRVRLAAVVNGALVGRCLLSHDGLEVMATTSKFPDPAIADWCESAVALSTALASMG